MANGCNQNPIGKCSTTEGINTTVTGTASHAEGSSSNASGNASHAEGYSTQTTTAAAHAEGSDAIASGVASHAEGFTTTSSGNSSHAEGSNTTAEGASSHAEGFQTYALADASHAQGAATRASGFASHAEGLRARALTDITHAEGKDTTARGIAAHAEGDGTISSGRASHSEGIETIASGDASHAEGENTNTAFFANSHIMGRFGDADEANSWFIGNGTSRLARGIGAKWSGTTFDMLIDGAYLSSGQDYAEMFETLDGSPIDVGFFVTAAERGKVRKATEKDSFLLGITSAMSNVIGNSGGLRWRGKYITDEWGRKQYQEVTIPAKTDQEGNILISERKENQPILNPAWNPNEKYIPRHERPEWVAVALLGQVLVRDDGTCKEQGYCWPNGEGIATNSNKGYRVLKRTGPNQILVLVK